jgi:predicted MPP superfamily phosphohydrolase
MLTVYGGVNFLIFSKIRQALAGTGAVRAFSLVLFCFWMISYPAGLVVESRSSGMAGRMLVQFGSFYLGVMAYAFLVILLAESAWGLNRLFHWIPQSWLADSFRALRFAFAGAAGVVLIFSLAGYVNALFPRVKKLDVVMHAPGAAMKTFRIVLVSDLHLGIVQNPSRMEKIVDAVNGLSPDAVLICGDLVDRDAFQHETEKHKTLIRNLKSKYGVFAVTGNHEYYAGLSRSEAFMKESDVTLLQDSTVILAGQLCLIGRKDQTAGRMGDFRMPLNALAAQNTKNLPMILMDHQPFRLNEAEAAGIGLQVSGHTHHGQLFPFNWITNAVYEKSWGYLKKGNTQVYVSCGAGTWGPPVRTAGVPEIVDIHIQFIQ